MKVIGIIAEYNPFHNGHQYHLTTAKQLTGASYSVGVMSGSFLQRGEPALVNKWARAQMALAAGMDLVVELPTAYATRSAHFFAEGAVRLLEATGIVTHLCFGSELGSLTPLAEVASLVVDEPQELSLLIKQQLSQGLVYPSARAKAISEYVLLHNYDPQIAWGEILASPNNILGIEYLRALKLINSPIEAFTLRRNISGHNDLELGNSSIASATSIRLSLRNQGQLAPELKNFVPEGTWNSLNHEFEAGRGPVFLEDLFPYLMMKLRTSTTTSLSQIVDVAEGLEFRIWEAAQKATSFDMLVDKIKTKRYTRTRIQRILLHCLLGYTTDLAKSFQLAGGPRYLRVLGFSDRGRILLKKMQERAQLPIVTKTAGLMKTPGVTADMLALDVLATNVHAVLYPNSTERKAGMDYFHSPINVSQQ